MKRPNYEEELLLAHKLFLELRDCGNADHLKNEDGSFKPTRPKNPGTVTIGYLEEACQWTYYRDDITDEIKLEKLLVLEGIIQKLLGEIKYVPSWSPKLKQDEKH